MTYAPINEMKVFLDLSDNPMQVGRLAIRDRQIYFEYDRDFLERNLEISPLRLPLKSGVQTFDRFLFEGLSGVFNDSLPDGWGRLLLDRSMRAKGIMPDKLTPLDRLAHVGRTGMGALVYEPDYAENKDTKIDLDILASYAQDVMAGEADDVLQELLSLNGSSAGARPKAMIGLDNERKILVHGSHDLPDGFQHWLVKFANSTDGQDAGAIEYVYALMAKDAGLEISPAHLFPAKSGAGYFAARRFDREHNKRLHMHTVCGLLHSDFRTPSLDYEDLLALTGKLTHDMREVEKMFRLAVFNVLSHNRDDHSKNFSFLMNATGEWALSPAYDLTFSSGPRGEQSTMVMGEGKNPCEEHLIKLGESAGLDQKKIQSILDQTKNALGQWKRLAEAYGVSKANIALIGKNIIQ